MARKFGLLLFVLLLSSFPVSAQWFPHIALGGGYELIVIATSKVDAPLGASFQLRTGNGALWESPVSIDGNPALQGNFSFDLPPKGTARFLVTGDEVLRAGYLVPYGASPYSGTDMDVICFYNFRQDGKLLDSTGVPRTWGSRGWRIPVEKSNTVNTGLAWSAIAAHSPFEVKATLFGADGTVVESKTLVFEGHRSLFVDEMFDLVPDQFVGHVEVVGDNGVGMTVLRLEWVGGGFQLTSTPPVSFTPAQ